MSFLRSRLVRLVALVVISAVVAASCGSDTEAIALGDTSFSRAELDELLDGRFPETADGNHPLENVAPVLSDLAFFEALATELDLELTDADLTGAAAQLEEDGVGFDGSTYVADTPWGDQQERSIAIRDRAVAWIDAEVANLDLDAVEALCSSHVLVATEEEADAVVERLDAGEDFAEVAATTTIDPTGAANGGDLGCVPASGFDPDFVAGARAVAPAGRTGPVESSFGWHVIELRSFGPATVEVHPELDAAGLQRLQEQALQVQGNIVANDLQQAALDRISSELELDPRFGAWDTERVEIVPPDGVTEPSLAPVPLDGIGG